MLIVCCFLWVFVSWNHDLSSVPKRTYTYQIKMPDMSSLFTCFVKSQNNCAMLCIYMLQQSRFRIVQSRSSKVFLCVVTLGLVSIQKYPWDGNELAHIFWAYQCRSCIHNFIKKFDVKKINDPCHNTLIIISSAHSTITSSWLIFKMFAAFSSAGNPTKCQRKSYLHYALLYR